MCSLPVAVAVINAAFGVGAVAGCAFAAGHLFRPSCNLLATCMMTLQVLAEGESGQLVQTCFVFRSP